MERFHRKKEAEAKGFYFLDHECTGKVYTGKSTNIMKEVLAIRAALRVGNCKCKKLQKLFNSDPEFDVRFILTKAMPDAALLEKEFRKGKPKHLLIN